MRRSLRIKESRGQSLAEFLFVLFFFMMFVTFLRAFVLFELDVFNQSNVARYKLFKYLRSSVDGQSFGKEEETNIKTVTGLSFQKVTSMNLRPILFLRESHGTVLKLPEREYFIKAGTKYHSIAAPFADGTQAIPIALLGYSP